MSAAHGNIGEPHKQYQESSETQNSPGKDHMGGHLAGSADRANEGSFIAGLRV